MNRAMRQASKREGLRRQRQPWDRFEDVTTEAYHRHKVMNAGWGMDKLPDQVYANSQYIVMIYRDRCCLNLRCDKVMIRRCDSEPVTRWSDIQRLKNEIFGEDVEGFQMFPRQSELVNDFNVYWLWIIREYGPDWDIVSDEWP